MEKFIPYSKLLHAAKQNAKAIDRKYDKGSKPIVMLCLLSNGVQWASEVARNLSLECEIEYVNIGVDKGLFSKKSPYVKVPPTIDLNGRDVIIMSGLINTGTTNRIIHEYLAVNHPHVKSVTSCPMMVVEGAMVDPEFLGYIVPTESIYKGFGISGEDGTGKGYKDVFKKKKK